MRERRGSSLSIAVIGTLALVVGAAGCGGDDGGGGTPAQPGTFEGKGPITWATGKDTSGYIKSALDKWNKDHPNEQVRLIELPEAADEQRQQLIQNAQTKSDAYSVVSTSTWSGLPSSRPTGGSSSCPRTSSRWTRCSNRRSKRPSTSTSCTRRPGCTDGGLLYYRKDLLDAAGVTSAPKTWDEMKQACQKVPAKARQGIGCYAGQFEKYEGLTVNFSEAVNSAGGVVVDDEGKPNVEHARGQAGPGLPRRRLQVRDDPEGGHHLQGGGGPAGVPGRQAGLPPAVAVPVGPGERHRRLVQGRRQVRGGPAARVERTGRVHPRRPQPGDQQVRQEQGHRAGVHQVHHQRGRGEGAAWRRRRRRRSTPRCTTTRSL